VGGGLEITKTIGGFSKVHIFYRFFCGFSTGFSEKFIGFSKGFSDCFYKCAIIVLCFFDVA